jgi:hypothetical protein
MRGSTDTLTDWEKGLEKKSHRDWEAGLGAPELKIGGTYQPKPSPFPGGGPPISAITGKPETIYVPGKEPEAGIWPIVKGIYADKPITRVKIFAEARGIPISRYRIYKGNIIFQDEEGNWQREVGELGATKLKEMAITGLGHPVTTLSAIGAGLGGVKGAVGGAMLGEAARKGVGKLVYKEPIEPARDLIDIGMEGVFALAGEAVGKMFAGKVARHFPKRKDKPLFYAGAEIRRGLLTPENHAKAMYINALAQEHGIQLAPHQLYDREGMTNLWKYLRKHPLTSDHIQVFEKRLAKSTDEAIDKFIRDMGGYELDPFALGSRLKETATKIIKDKEQMRGKLVNRIYGESFRQSKAAGGVDLTKAVNIVNRKYHAWPEGSAERKILQNVKKQLTTDRPIPTPERAAQVFAIESESGRFRIAQLSEGVADQGNRWIAHFDEDLENGLRGLMRDVQAGEPGGRQFLDIAPGEGGGREVAGYASTYPEFMRNQGWSAQDVMGALQAAIDNQPLGQQQAGIVESALRSLEEAEREAFGFFEDIIPSERAALPEAEEMVRPFRRPPPAVQTERVPIKNLKVIQKAIFHINDLIEGATYEAAQVSPSNTKFLNSDLYFIKKNITDKIHEVAPDYKRATRTFERISKPVDRLKQSVLGVVADLRADPTIAKAPGKFLNIVNMPDDKLLSAAKKEIVKVDPGLWRRTVGGYIRDTYENLVVTEQGSVVNAAGKLHKRLFGTEKRKKLMKAALDPEEYKSFEGLMTVFQRASIGTGSESMTAPFQMVEKELSEQMSKKYYQLLEYKTRALREWTFGKWHDVYMAGQHVKLLEVLVSPDAIKRIREMRRLSPGSRKLIEALTVFTAETLIHGKDLTQIIGDQLVPAH